MVHFLTRDYDTETQHSMKNANYFHFFMLSLRHERRLHVTSCGGVKYGQIREWASECD